MSVRGPLIVLALVASATGLGWAVAKENRWSLPTPLKHAFQAEAVAPASTPSPEPVLANPSAEPAPPSDDALGYMFMQVADQYEHNSRYPAYSVPLSRDQAAAYAGNHFDPITLPLSNGGEFTVSLEKFRFTRGQDILVVASLSGPMVVGHTMSARLESATNGSEAGSATLSPAEDGFLEGIMGSDVSPGEYRLIVEASVDGKPLRHVSTLTIEPDLGEFEGIDSPHVSGNDLVIPFQFDARETGAYALSGHLFANGQPIAHLTLEQHLDNRSNTIELKAHGSVLASHTDKETMTLKNLQIRRLPARPGDRTDYAFGPEEGYQFSPPDLDSLEDTSARDPLSEQRAALLKSMAGKF